MRHPAVELEGRARPEATPAKVLASQSPKPKERLPFGSSLPARAEGPGLARALPSMAPAQAELMASLSRLRARFRDVAAVVEGLGALRSLGGEEALIEMAMFAQSHEQTVEQAWKALGDCEQAARLACSALVPSQRAPSDPVQGLSTEPAPAPPSSVLEHVVEEEGPVTQVDVGPSRVLVVDDDPTVLRAFRRVLSTNHEIVTARDGAEALRVVLGGKRVDAIICDIGMPKLDGPTFFSELFELRPQMMPRVVFCTGGMPNDKTQRFLDRLQAPLLFKPVAAADLLSAIEFVRTR
jgi:CheY-like chemotaxis protein